MARSVAFHTLGCKLNFSESSAIARMFYERGYEKRKFNEKSDIYVINTCSVTEQADKECRSIVRSALQLNPDAFIAVIGCYAQLKPNEIAAIDGVDVVLGANDKFRLLEYVSEFKREQALVMHCDVQETTNFISTYSHGDRTRTFLKVQDGCDYNCTFCTIPQARGRSRSDSIENTLKLASQIAKTGIKEVVLTGVNLGDFGYGQLEGLGRTKRKESFYDLIRALDTVEGIERFRISSIEPNLLTDEIIAFVASSTKFVPHFHIPLQSGSNSVLKLMKRRYLREVYTSRIEAIRNLMPNACVGVDVIVGFPGESDEAFKETKIYLAELDVNYFHVFTYSERANTEALSLAGSVPINERKKRNKELRLLSARKQEAFYSNQKGKIVNVLFEQENKDGFLYGYSENYVRVKHPFDARLVNQIQSVQLGESDHEGAVSGLIQLQTA